jgi:hypothetical protein
MVERPASLARLRSADGSVALSVGLGTVLVCAPLVLMLAVAWAIRESPSRSAESAAFRQQPSSWWLNLIVVGVAAAVFALGTLSRAETLYLILVVLSVLGAAVVERSLLSLVEEITMDYVNPGDWEDGRSPPMARWRYQMRAHFVHDPEWVDRIAIEMVRAHPTYAAFRAAIESEEFPADGRKVLHERLWGPVLPTVAQLLSEAVAISLFHPKGRFRTEKSADAIYAELHEMSSGDPRALMDRWQYYWCLRNLNAVDKQLSRAHGNIALVALVLLGAVVFAGGVALTATERFSAGTLLRAEAAGALLWLLLVCGGASIFIIGVFRGTGTFSIARPTRGTDFDPLWTRVIQVGILAFAVSFVVYGIGFPFLLEPTALREFDVDHAFLIYAGGSFLFCLTVFVVHTFGVHNLMRASRENALDRAAEDLRNGAHDESTLDHFKDVRGMRVWPLRSSTVFQLAGGILLPVAAQSLLIYSGLS